VSQYSTLVNKIPTVARAVEILQQEVDSAFGTDADDITILKPSVNDGSEDLSSEADPPPSKKKKSMFNLIQKVAETAPSAAKDKGYEVQNYLKLDVIGENESPLKFWQKNEVQFPNLAILARKYLAIPATSGEIERLFSVAGAIARSRRARLTIPNLEKMLCCQQHQHPKNPN